MAKKTPSLSVGRGEKLPVSKGAGLTAKGRAKYNAATGSNLKAPQPKGGKRKDSFCARMSGMPGPMEDDAGRPTRKATELRDPVERAISDYAHKRHATILRPIPVDWHRPLRELLDDPGASVDTSNPATDRHRKTGHHDL